MRQATESGTSHVVLEEGRVRALHWVIAGLAFLLAMSASAYVAVPVPWSPVPMTLQSLVVILAGAVLGPIGGATTMATYLALGAAGLPVFSAGHAGLIWLVGPTGGYLMAFPAAALVTGLIVRPSAGVARSFFGLALGTATIFLGGITYLRILTQQDLGGLLSLGVWPFLGGALVKVLLALLVLRVYRGSNLRLPDSLDAS